MTIDWDVPIEMDDGLVLRADVFRPADDEPPRRHRRLRAVRQGADVPGGLPRRLARDDRGPPGRRGRVEQPLPGVGGLRPREVGARRLRLRARRCARLGPLPGFIEPWSPREAKDLHDCIEWAGGQPWSYGKVGLLGISYYAINQWHVAGLQPPHLAAMIPWEGFADFYRDFSYHGGIGSDMKKVWYRAHDHDGAARPRHAGRHRTRNTGELAAGPETLTDEELAANRTDFIGDIDAHDLDDAWHRERSAALGSDHACPSCRRGTGEARRCTCGATSRRSCRPPPSRSGSRSTGSSTGPSSTPTTGWRCSIGSSTTSSRARTTAGTPSRA